MEHRDILPDQLLSHHVESYWHVFSDFQREKNSLEMFLPTCTFNIIFISQECYVKNKSESNWRILRKGGYFVGQTSLSLIFKSDQIFAISGIRFKPFAFANIIKRSLVEFNDKIIEIERVFYIDKNVDLIMRSILMEGHGIQQVKLFNEFTYDLISISMEIDERLRAQLNCIMNNHGRIKIKSITETFDVSKVTLNNHFIKKVGLSPKKVSQIWRMNRILQLKKDCPNLNLTKIGLEVGYFDQAHFIKDFNSLLNSSPSRFFNENSKLIGIEYVNISKRFTNQYDPILA